MKIVLLESLGVPRRAIEAHAEKLRALGHTFVSYEKNTDPRVQRGRCRDADAIILANMPLSRQAVENSENLKFIDVAFTGVDHIPMEIAKRKGITVSNASGYATEAVAELCLSFMISLLRNVPQTGDRCRRGGTKDGLVGNLLSGKTVGIVGAGAIGKRVAALCKAFGCKVLAYNRSKVADPNFHRQVSLPRLLENSDIVSLHVPLTRDTKGLIGKKELRTMKKSAVLINTARGPVVDSAALAAALKDGTIAGAALDVFDKEPPLDPSDPLLHTPNTIVTPHIGFASRESLLQRVDIVFDNLYSFLSGRPKNLV